jgi:hypothetical protein
MTPEEIARKYYRYFNERRLDEAGRLVHPQAVFHYVATRQRLVGRAGYRALAAAWLIAFEDAELELASVTTLDAHRVTIDFVGRGTHTGELTMGESLTIPATGRRMQLDFTDTLEIHGGLITHSELEFDVEAMKRDLLGPQPISGA